MCEYALQDEFLPCFQYLLSYAICHYPFRLFFLVFSPFFLNLYPFQSEDGVCFPCHRCVLVARLEFFAAMFSSGWLETSTTTESKCGKRQPKQALPMPFNADVLAVILRFVYADDTPEVRECGSMSIEEEVGKLYHHSRADLINCI